DYYQRLLKIDDSFQIWVNYAIAICEEGEPNKALEILRGINQKGAYKNSILFGAFARVHLKLKQIEMAKSYYKVAIDMTNNINERVFYETKISKLLLNTDGMSN
ncbi:MAG: tetratricopeptide repeat protein, partial [Balneolaceae bacterium]